ncbi:hypothetical protein OQA88_4189 [Cercophora sp. LCS_1]
MTSAIDRPSVHPDEDFPIVLTAEEELASRKPFGGNSEVGPHRKQDEPPAPQHPIPFMQDAFAESLIEATQGGAVSKPKLRTGDAKTRRGELLDQEKSDPPPAALWRYRPGQVNHELRRLMAQISFGVYLLLNGMANSQVLVVSILQGHIDEVDEFLETTLEDMGIASADLQERIDHLKLPMQNMQVFEDMLKDAKFCRSILEGNLKIEHIVARTQISMQQTVQDLAEGVSATREFSIYLAEQENGSWRRDRPDVIDIFDAMKGNTDGWFNAFIDLQAKASTLNGLIVRLTGMVAEMEKKASEASIEQQASPHHSHHSSVASSFVGPPASPLPKISSSPPRLSLRLSTISNIQPPRASAFFDPPSAKEPPVAAEEAHQTPTQETVEVKIETVAVTEADKKEEVPPPPELPPARNPRRLSERPAPRLEVVTPRIESPRLETPEEDPGEGPEEGPEEKQEEETDALYILQPRTYTPQPPSPLPSPRVKDPAPRVTNDLQSRRRADPARSPKPTVEALSVAVRVSTHSRDSRQPLSPRLQQAQLRSQPSKPRLVAISASKSVRKPSPRPAPQPELQPQLEVVIAEPEPEPEPEVQPRQRTSLRQRVSLKTTPPESIHVPPPDALEYRRPRYQQSPRLYQAPDSAYASDMERPPVNSIASINSSLADFPTPPPRPMLVPSPHSDQQFFRPVQASPHSPLQQRPHTSGTVSSRVPPQHIPPRDIPSAMGMSMLSNVTTMTNESGSSRTLKKKRSAFGWLKKAFSLDEEERAAFEQKKREQARNLYYDDRSPKYLDGKRVQPRQTQTFYN